MIFQSNKNKDKHINLYTDLNLNLKSVFTLIFIFTLSTFQLSCGGNAFSQMSVKDSDEALFKDAEILIDAGDYSGAITKILATSSSFQSLTTTKRALAGAYAAKCGLRAIDFFNGLGGTGTMFTLYMKGFQTIASADIDPASCDSAQNIMESIGTVGQRTQDQNFFLALLGMAKIGSQLRITEDISPVDGTVDSAANACKTATITDAQVARTVEGLGLIIENLTAFSAAVGGAGSALTAINDMNTACTGAGLNCSITHLSATDPSYANTVLAFRKIIDNNTYGVGACADNTFVTCCPSP